MSNQIDGISTEPLTIEEFYFIQRAVVITKMDSNDIALANLLLAKAISEGVEPGKPQWHPEDQAMFNAAMERIHARQVAIDPSLQEAPTQGA